MEEEEEERERRGMRGEDWRGEGRSGSDPQTREGRVSSGVRAAPVGVGLCGGFSDGRGRGGGRWGRGRTRCGGSWGSGGGGSRSGGRCCGSGGVGFADWLSPVHYSRLVCAFAGRDAGRLRRLPNVMQRWLSIHSNCGRRT